MFDFRKVFVRGNSMAKMTSYECFTSPCQAYLLCLCNLIAKASTQLAEHCHFDILGDGCELAFCGLSMRGLLFSVPRSQEREFDCFWMHQIGLRSKQKERKQNTDKSGSKEESKHNVGNSLFNVLRRLERLLP